MMKTLGINLEMCKGTVYQSLFQAHMSGVGRTAFQWCPGTCEKVMLHGKMDFTDVKRL